MEKQIKIEEGKVYKTKNGQYIHVKEVTYFFNDSTEGIYNIVTGNECEYENDSKTSAIRAVFNYNKFIDLIEEPKKTLWDKREVADGGVGYERMNTKDVKEALKAFKNKLGYKNEDEPDYLCPYSMGEIYSMLREIFGEEMIENE